MKTRLPNTERSKFPVWAVDLFLGDQCQWSIRGYVEARTDLEAVREGRRVLQEVWPELYRQYENSPMTAMQITGRSNHA